MKRRTFLVGVGGLITVPLVEKFISFAREERRPMLLTPPKPAETLYVYPPDYEDEQGYLVTLGSAQLDPPPTTWEAFLLRQDYDLSDPSVREEIEEEWGVIPDQFKDDCPARHVYWEWAVSQSPSAQAFTLLEGLDLGPALRGRRNEKGRVDFIEGSAPGDSSRWVECKDLVTISLLQARLRELELPIAVAMGDPDAL